MDQGIISQSQAEILDKYSPESKFVNGNIFGTVTDYGNRPLADAVVTYADETYLTDEEGHFIIRDQQLDANGTFLRVEKEGFFKGFPRFYPSSGATSYVDVELIPHNIIGEFEAESGGVITGEDDLEFQFPPNGIERASGEQYSGTVQVVANYLDPTICRLRRYKSRSKSK
jgi:hypothetical protein